MNTQIETSVGSGVDATYGSHRNSRPSRPTTLSSMSLDQFRSEINGHLYGDKRTVSHFSSWTADFQIARRYAWSEYTWNGYTPPSPSYPRIGVLDTSRRHYGNVIFHVRALREEFHTSFNYDYEYLVYGPVTGVAYNCLSLSRRQNTPAALHPPLYSDWSGWPVIRSFYGLSEIRKAYNRAARRSFYYAAGAGSGACWVSCPDTALYLTMIAAQWSQDTWHDWGLVLRDSTETEKRWQEILSDLSQVMEWAARDATLVLPLVNPLTNPDDSRKAPLSDPLRWELMFKLLLHFEAEIIRLRSKSPSEPSPAPWFLTRFLWGST